MSVSTDYKMFSILRWPICLSALNFIWPIGQVNNQIFEQKLQQQQEISQHIRQTPIENFRSDYLFSVSFLSNIYIQTQCVITFNINIRNKVIDISKLLCSNHSTQI